MHISQWTVPYCTVLYNHPANAYNTLYEINYYIIIIIHNNLYIIIIFYTFHRHIAIIFICPFARAPFCHYDHSCLKSILMRIAYKRACYNN